MPRIVKILCIVALLFLLGCQSKKINHRYEIEEFSEGETVYYILETGVDSAGGVFDGIIHEIGWKGEEIAARVERLSSADKGGWYILNINTGVVIGPIDYNEVASKYSPVDVREFYSDPSKYRTK